MPLRSLAQTIRNSIPTPLAILLGVFIALALFYSIIIPLFEGPDEDDHFRYAQFIADQRALPIQLFEPGGGIAGHQGWQPPLYYSLVALIVAPIDKSDYEQHLWRNSAVTFVGDPSCCGRDIYYHTDSENFPYTRTTLAVHLARLLSIFFGAVTVWATFILANTLVHAYAIRHAPSAIPLATASIVAFNPSFLFASALVSNDSLLTALSTVVLLVWVGLMTGTIAAALKSSVILGALIGLGILTKTTALGLIPFSMLALAIVAWRRRDLRFAISGNAAMLAMIALISGWWFVRNQMLYGDPLAYRLMIASAIFPRAGPLTLPEVFQISVPWLWQTFWGGPTPGDLAIAILIALGALSVLALVGMILFVMRSWRLERSSSIFVLGAWLGLILIAQIQFIRTTAGADQGRYLFPAISVIALFFVLGLIELSRFVRHISNLQSPISNLQFAICSLVIVLFFALALFVPFAYTLPAYARPPLLSPNALTRISHPIQATFADQFQLLGYDLDTRAIRPGDTLQIALYWRALTPMNESYRVFVHLIGQGDRSAGGADVIPARGAFPTVYWKPGDTLRDVVQVAVAPNASPGKYEIEVGAYPVGKPGERLTALPTNDDRVFLGAIKIAPRETSTFTPRTRVDANFANLIDLLGYDAISSQDTIQLTVYWRARATIDRDYTVFVHALDASGKIIAQVDRAPQNGNYPTSLWDAGEQIRDDYVLALPLGTIAQRIAIGLYRSDTGARLPVADDDHVEILLRGAGQ